MTAFLIALATLVVGYFVYGLIVEKIFGIDPKRDVPANYMRDNVDYLPMPTWRACRGHRSRGHFRLRYHKLYPQDRR